MRKGIAQRHFVTLCRFKRGYERILYDPQGLTTEELNQLLQDGWFILPSTTREKKKQTRYGIYRKTDNRFVYGIAELSEQAAWNVLQKRIGKNAKRWKYETRVVKG